MLSAISQHLQDLGRSIDIIRDKEFKSANYTLDGILNSITKTGAPITILSFILKTLHEFLNFSIRSLFSTCSLTMSVVQLVYASCYSWFRIPLLSANGLVSISKGRKQLIVGSLLFSTKHNRKTYRGVFDQKTLNLERVSLMFLRIRFVR